MKNLFNMTYIAIALGFIRKIITKCTYRAQDGIPEEQHDTEGCWCLVYNYSVCLEYTRNKAKLIELGNEIMKAVPKLKGHFSLIEDDDMGTDSVEEITVLTQGEVQVVRHLIQKFNL